MRRPHSYFFVASLVCIFVAPLAFAEDASTTVGNSVQTQVTPVGGNGTLHQALEERRDAIEAHRDDAIQRIASTSELLREKIQERRMQLAPHVKDRIKNLFENVKARIAAAIDRLDNIAGRIESRAHKMEASGTDTTEALARVADARVSLDTARSALGDASTVSLEGIVDAGSPSEKFTSLRTRVATIHNALMSARSSLRDAVALLENGKIRIEAHASSTASTTTSQ